MLKNRSCPTILIKYTSYEWIRFALPSTRYQRTHIMAGLNTAYIQPPIINNILKAPSCHAIIYQVSSHRTDTGGVAGTYAGTATYSVTPPPHVRSSPEIPQSTGRSKPRRRGVASHQVASTHISCVSSTVYKNRCCSCLPVGSTQRLGRHLHGISPLSPSSPLSS